MVSGFVKDYTIWKKHGETDAPPPMNKPLDEIIQGEEFDRMFDAYYDFNRGDDGVSVDDGVGDSIVMMSMTGPSIVTVVKMNLTTKIFWASCCATPKQRYWLLVPGGYQTSRMWENQQRKIYMSDPRDARNTGPSFVSYWSCWLWRLSIVGQMVVSTICYISWLGCFQSQIKSHQHIPSQEAC